MPKGNVITKKQVVVPTVTAALILMLAPTMAFAQNPHFIRDPVCTVDRDGNLDCSGRIAGLGNELTQVNAFLTADVIAVFGCDNPGQGVHIPPGQGTDTQDVQGDPQSLPVKGGSVRFGLEIPVPEPSSDLDCPNERWDVVLVSVEYSNVEVVIEGFEPLEIPGTFSRELIEV
jgi:hypothetical protein